jgi:hypothetical protein
MMTTEGVLNTIEVYGDDGTLMVELRHGDQTYAVPFDVLRQQYRGVMAMVDEP